jgi:ABC-type sugar transport system ATPase subunit
MADVDIKKLSKSYDHKTQVLRDIDVSIQSGEFIVLVGPSGCGKSTLLRTIAGLEDITSGEISIAGRVVNHLPPADRNIAMVFQDYALYPHMTVRQNLAFGLKVRKTPRAEIEKQIGVAADILGLQPLLDRKPSALSGGQRQRVAIGRAIVRKPENRSLASPLRRHHHLCDSRSNRGHDPGG